MSNKIIKGALVGVVGVSAATTGYYTMVKPNLSADTPTTATTSTSTSSENKNSSSSTQNSTSSGQYKDGTYTGSVASTKRGDFQVSVEVSGGKITNINMLTQPTEGKSAEINKTAIPTYVQEAIDAQGTDIQLVSGASETYSGFKTSLQNALNQAK
ncbi:FMN-binding protein [Gemella sanguinis]